MNLKLELQVLALATTTSLKKVLGMLKANTSTLKLTLLSLILLTTTFTLQTLKVGWLPLTMHCKTTLACLLTTVSTGKTKTVTIKLTSTVQTLTTNSNLIVINTKETPSGVSFFRLMYIPIIN